MLPLIIYALGVFILCFVSIWYMRRKVSTFLLVALCTVLSPIVMQGLSVLVFGYLDPFWKWTTPILGLIALVSSVTALGVCAAIEQGEEKQ
jgi:hypothetical protein